MLAFIDDARVRALIRPADLVAVMERALIDVSAGRVRQPVRTILPIEEHGGFFAVMPAVHDGVIGTKLVSFYPGNTGGLPRHHGLIGLFDAKTGAGLAVIDARLITDWRTAAVSAVAMRALAAPGARVLGVLGSGAQARCHIEALRAMQPFAEVLIWSRNPANAAGLAAETRARAVPAEEAVAAADVIVTATASPEPVLRGAWLKPGALVLAVGSVGPTQRELDDAAMRNVVVVDSRAAALVESGDVILSGATVAAELGEILAGAATPPAGRTVVFKSVGLAVEDVAAAKLVYDRACAEDGPPHAL